MEDVDIEEPKQPKKDKIPKLTNVQKLRKMAESAYVFTPTGEFFDEIADELTDLQDKLHWAMIREQSWIDNISKAKDDIDKLKIEITMLKTDIAILQTALPHQK